MSDRLVLEGDDGPGSPAAGATKTASMVGFPSPVLSAPARTPTMPDLAGVDKRDWSPARDVHAEHEHTGEKREESEVGKRDEPSDPSDVDQRDAEGESDTDDSEERLSP